MGKQYQMVVEEVAMASPSGAPPRPLPLDLRVILFRFDVQRRELLAGPSRASRARGRGFLHDRASV